MGMSLDADIRYGMVLYDSENTYIKVPWRKEWGDDGFDEDEDADFEEWVCEQLGLAPLDYSTYPEERYDPRVEKYDTYSARQKELSEAWGKLVGRDEYYAKKKGLIATVPVEEVCRGTEEARSTLLCLKASPKVHAYYYPEAFDPTTLQVSVETDLNVRRWLAKYDVVWDPKWLLVPSYG